MQMYVPNNVKSFGSASHEIKLSSCATVNVLSLEQTQWKYLDKGRYTYDVRKIFGLFDIPLCPKFMC